MTLLVCLLLLVCPLVVSQEQQSLDRYYEQAREAIEAENYETAVRIIEEAQQWFPGAAQLNLLLADLYYDKELYKLALEEYLSAVEKEGEDFLTLVQLSRCYGKLNQEQESITTLERVLELYPESVSSIDDLGWMYFKTHQLDKGEELLLEALERLTMRTPNVSTSRPSKTLWQGKIYTSPLWLTTTSPFSNTASTISIRPCVIPKNRSKCPIGHRVIWPGASCFNPAWIYLGLCRSISRPWPRIPLR
jgi:tetratricopeptide (TPR) repeat protein